MRDGEAKARRVSPPQKTVARTIKNEISFDEFTENMSPGLNVPVRLSKRGEKYFS
jgi:hypothetical protein